MQTKMVDFNYMGELDLITFGEGITPIKANDRDLLLPAKGKKKKGFKKRLTNKEVIDGSKR